MNSVFAWLPCVLAWFFLSSRPLPVAAQTDSVMASPRQRYDAGALQRFFLGSHHRDLWALSVRAEVLRLDDYAGGLRLEGLGGGQQTRSLRFRSADGREFAFRLIDKDAARTLDPELRRSIAAAVLQDQISALLPMGPLVVAPLVEAAGVLQASPELFVMPDDSRLGEHRAEFANRLGFVEERPNEGPGGEPGFAGADSVVGYEEFLDRIEEDPQNQVDERAFIRARLIDAFVGDWDRHPDQWRWASFKEGAVTRWVPVPRDRDWALAKLDGLLVWAAGFAFPNYVGFDDDYPSAFRLTWAGRALDRRLLTETPRSVWLEEANQLSERLSDTVIDSAVRRLPPPYLERIGPDLSRALMKRRDQLTEFALEFYELLAEFVDVHATDTAEIARLERHDGDSVRLTIATLNATAPHYSRTFQGNETREVRLWMHGGADRVEVGGAPGGSIRLRILGGGGDDMLADQTTGERVHFYDDRGDNTFVTADGTSVDESAWEAPAADTANDVHRAPPRDWGSWWIPYPIVAFQPDVGLVVGAGFIRYGYGFRHYPWDSRLGVSLGFGTGSLRPQANVDYQFHAGSVRSRFRAKYSGLDRQNFFGFGNETENTEGRSFYRAERELLELSAAVRAGRESIDFAVGPVFRAVRPIENEATLLDTLEVYGNGRFRSAGFMSSFEVDTRNSWPAASRGVHLKIDGRYFPAVLDVSEPFGGVRGEGSVRVGGATPASLVLALRTGGEKVWGKVPLHEAAYIGGNGTVRGFANQRFAGQAAVFANAELRFPVTRFFFMLPGHLGLFGLADTGRVFVSGESSSLWHSAAGGGLWISVLSPANALSIAVARSRERTGVYIQAGFMF